MMEQDFFERVCTEFYRRVRRRRKRMGVRFSHFARAVAEVAEDIDSDRESLFAVCFPALCSYGVLVYPHEVFFARWRKRACTFWRWVNRHSRNEECVNRQVNLFVDRLFTKLHLAN